MTAQQQVNAAIRSVQPIEPAQIAKAYERLDFLTKPKRSLGYLEELAARLAAILQTARPRFDGKGVFVFVGDHQVVAEGVSAYPQEVTGLMVKNFLGGGAAINVLARRAGATVTVVDIGMATDLGALSGLRACNVKRGAANIARGPAMTVEEAEQALAVGIHLAWEAQANGITCLATGEMGIGNTTPAAALFAALLRRPAAEMVGPGTGLDPQGVQVKIRVVEQALHVNRTRCTSVLETLAALGGLEIAGIAGLCLGAAASRRPVVVDGFISSAGALVAMRLCPAVKDYLFFAHRSAEPGHQRFFEEEKLRPIVDLGMRLGEGTGAAIALQILEDALAIYNEMATFADAGIKPGA